MWTDSLGRTYEYTPHTPELLAETGFEFLFGGDLGSC
jgi:hypothetical protein